MFEKIRSKMVSLVGHDNAIYYLGFFTFIEAIFFPVPPDVMLAPMVAAKPEKARRYCLTVVLISIFAGMCTYLFSYYAFDHFIEPILKPSSYYDEYLTIVSWFDEWGILVVIASSLLFIPYKLIAIAAGVVDIGFINFLLASMFTRSLRFYIVTAIAKYSSEKILKKEQ